MFGPIWRTWWPGDAVGAVVVTPLVVLWREGPRLEWTRKRLIELFLLLLGLSFTAWIVFGGRFHSEIKNSCYGLASFKVFHRQNFTDFHNSPPVKNPFSCQTLSPPGAGLLKP